VPYLLVFIDVESGEGDWVGGDGGWLQNEY